MCTDGDLITPILQALDRTISILSSQTFPNANAIALKSAIDRLASREMVKYETIEQQEVFLEPEGEQIAANGSHEGRVFEALRDSVAGLSIQDLEKKIGDKEVVKIGQGRAFKEKWISKTKGKRSDAFSWLTS